MTLKRGYRSPDLLTPVHMVIEARMEVNLCNYVKGRGFAVMEIEPREGRFLGGMTTCPSPVLRTPSYLCTTQWGCK